MRALVTGGGGGSSARTSSSGWRATGRGARARQLRHRPAREPRRASRTSVELIEGDIQSYERVHNAVRGCEIVFHQAALPSVPRSVQDPLTSNAVERHRHAERPAGGARRGGAAGRVRLVVVGLRRERRRCPSSEELPPLPIAPYAVAKLAAEGYCRSLPRGLRAGDGRPALLQRVRPAPGPALAVRRGDPAASSPPLLGTRHPWSIGDGEQSRDFTYVDNVVEANLLAAAAEGVGGQTFNIACGERITLNDLLGGAGGRARNLHLANDADPRAGDVKHSQADVSSIEQDLGYTTSVSFEEA